LYRLLESIPAAARRAKVNRWVRLSAAVVAMIQIANLQYAWTLFVQPLRDAHGWTLSEVQWGLAIFIALETWAMPMTGWLIDRHGARVLMSMAGLMCGIGWVGLGFAQSLPSLYILYALAGLGAAIVYCGSIGVALKWFPDRRGFAAGIIAAGFGSGSALSVPVVSYILKIKDYHAAFLYTGVFQGLLILVAAQFLSGAGVAGPIKSSQKTKARSHGQEFTSGEMLRTRHFYVLYAMMLMMGVGGLLATAQVAPVGRTFGIASGIITLSVTLNAVANGSGRFFWGWVSDHLGRERTMLIAFLIQSASLISVMALGSRSAVLFVAAMAMVFFTWGEVYSLFPSATADFFGARHASSNYSFMYSSKGVASILGTGLAARLFESSGSWAPVFYGSAVLALVSALMAVGLRKMPLPAKAGAPELNAVPARQP
jgi:MFS transporter, OFA family, oxalate/formate antiporter